MSTISDAVLNRELRKIFSQKGFDMDSETVKTIRARLCKSLVLQEFPSEQKATLNELIKRILNEKEEEEEKDFNPKKRQLKGKAVPKVQESDDEEEEDEGSNDEVSEEEEIFKQKKKKKALRPKEETKKEPESSSLPYNSDVKSLLELGTAMRMGPNLHRGLKSMDNSERMEVLTERLEMAGASWKGKIPSKTDVFKAKQKRQRQDDLDGLDPSVILETTGRRRSRAVASYADEKDEEEADKEEKEVEEEVELQKTKKNNKKKGSDDDDEDDHDFDGESSSEDEFDD